MNKIPTAEEMEQSGEYESYTSMMLAFARMHVEAALKAANIVTKKQEWIDDFINLKDKKCKDSILNSYPPTNVI